MRELIIFKSIKIKDKFYSGRQFFNCLLKLLYKQISSYIKKQHYSSLRSQMRRRQTITQQYSPTFRRRLSRNYLQLNLELSLKNMDSQRESARVKSQSPDFNQMVARAEQHFSLFIDHNIKINKIIDEVDLIIRNRMNAHEQGLISVVKSQIENMQRQCHKIVEQYNQMMNQKSKSCEIDSLRNELDYFRTSALSYYQMYQNIVKQNNQLRKQITQKYQIIDQLSSALRKTTKKYIKQKLTGGNNSLTQRKNRAHYFINNIQTEVPLTQNYEDKKELHTQSPNKNQLKSRQKLPSTQLLQKQRFLSSENCQRSKKMKNERKLSYQKQEADVNTHPKKYQQSKSISHKFTNSKSYCRTNISTEMGNRQNERDEVRKQIKIKIDDVQEIRNNSFRRSKAKTKKNDCLRQYRYTDKDNEEESENNLGKIQSTQRLRKQKTGSGSIYIDSHLKKGKIKQNQVNCGKSNSFWKFQQNPADQNQRKSSWVNY